MLRLDASVSLFVYRYVNGVISSCEGLYTIAIRGLTSGTFQVNIVEREPDYRKGTTATMTVLGAIEAGGTKFVCGIGNERGEVLERASFPTTTPAETMENVIAFLKARALKHWA